MHPNAETKIPYADQPTNGNGNGKPLEGRKRKQLATSTEFGPTFVTNSDGSTIYTTGASTRSYYRLARTNPEVKMAIRALKQATFWTEGQVQPINDYEKHPEFRELDELLTDLIATQLAALDNFHRFLQDIYVYALRCGYGVAEKIWEPVGDTWNLVGLKLLKPWDFEPIVDDFGDLEALFYYPTGEYFNPDAFIYAPWPSPGANNWLGEPVLESLIHDVELMQKTEAALAKTTHLLSRRTMIHRFDAMRDDNEIALAKQAVQDIERGKMPQFPCMPDDSGKLIHQDELSIMEDRTGTTAMVKLQELAVGMATRIKRAIGLPDDLGSTNASVGSNAKARTEFDMLMAGASDGQAWVRALVGDQIISDILEFNYPDRPPKYRDPAWIPQEVEEKFSLERAQYWKTLVDMGTLPANARIIAQDLGIPVDQLNEDEASEALAAAISQEIATSGQHSSKPISRFVKKIGPKLAFWR
jgi:hypothetical protein